MATNGPDPTTPLWRAAQLFRLLSSLYALGFHIAVNSDLRHPALGWLLFAVLIAWSVACAIAYLSGFGRRPAWVITELIVVVLLMLSTEVVASGQWAHNNQTWPTTLWASNATISAALQFGPTGGMLTGLAVTATSEAVKGYINVNLGRNATIIVELAVGLAVGLAARTARRAHDELQRAARLAAALEERERLSRQVHDGVIQVLALVAKRGHEIGGATSELAMLASEQERALRSWVTSTEMESDADASKTIDLRALLRRREADRVSMSLPGTPVLMKNDDRHRTRCRGRQCPGQRALARRTCRPCLRPAGGPGRIGHGQHPRRWRRASPPADSRKRPARDTSASRSRLWDG